MLNRVKKIISGFILFLIMTPLISAETYYVSSASEIISVMTSAVPGDTLVMMNGEWTNETIIFQGNGEAGNHIVLTVETPGYVILNGTSNLKISGTYLTVDGLYFLNGYSYSQGVVEFRNGSSNLANHCRLTNTAIVNYNPSSIYANYKWVSVYGTYNRVDHCYFQGKRHEGTTLVVWLNGNPNYHVIDSNYFAYRPELGMNGGETIRIGTSDWSQTDSYTLVENNYFERCNGEIEIISNKSGHNTFRYNTFYECQGSLTLRHGAFAQVYNNYFLGNKKQKTGGVRIIDSCHTVYNNYFEELRGTGFRAALTMMNGVPDSPLNRYFQVLRAEVVNNTFVDCEETFKIGAGNDSERTLPPTDCFISNNIVSTSYQMIDYDDVPINMTYEQNIMYGGPLGIDQPDGIKIVDPLLYYADDGLWRISEVSPAIDSASTNYSYVIDDMDGQIRGSKPDIGSDEYSDAEIIRRPLPGDDVGPYWYPPPAPPIVIVQIQAGEDSLLNAINKISEGDIIELVTDGGVYPNTQTIEVNFDIIIRGADSLVQFPEITQIEPSSSARTIFEIKDGGNLNLKRVKLNGLTGTSTPAKYLIRTDDNPFSSTYKLMIDSCYFYDVSIDGNGNFFRAYPGTFADSIVITNSLFTNCGKEGIRLKDEEANSSKYNVKYFEVSNSTFWNIPKEAINIYAGDNVIFTPGPKIKIDHVTFDNCGYDSTQMVMPEECDETTISNSIFSNGSADAYSVSMYGSISHFRYNDLFNSGDVELLRNAVLGNGIVDYDPLYEDAVNGNFILPSDSPILNKAENGSSLGDLRWAVNPRSYYSIQKVVFGEGEFDVDPETTGLNYDPGSVVTLTAFPAEGYEFYSWSGDVSETDSVIQVVMDDDKTIIATFTKIVAVNDVNSLPDSFELYQNYPNPFNPGTTIKYAVPTAAMVQIEIYDIRGKRVNTLVKSFHQGGYYQIYWEPNNLSTGLYLLKLSSGNISLSRKLLFIK